ncbi:hypothetical protein BDA99DRAFT_608407 [Phascolomyces articulosus]|uniref:Cysteine-rich transmembrane CYSTM domain-containing protein n=1 Tax=Phascolomyces articulosus TaxID=60185 RepID=A0AAD5P9P6_9FUNG|nr:hypothetical protein BDA99DRAFT_608407 [Phascolomyces articulosus]
MTSGAPILASAVAAALQSGYRPSALSNSYQAPLPMTTAASASPYYPPPPTGYPPEYYSNYYSQNYYPPPPPPMGYNNSTCCGVPDMCCLAFLLGACFGWCCADELGPPPQF